MTKKAYILLCCLFYWALGPGQSNQTFLKMIDPNPQDISGYDNSNNIWSIGDHVYVSNLYGDASGNRQTQIIKINSYTGEVVKQINLQGPQTDIACSSHGGYYITTDHHILLTGEWRDYEETRMRTFIAKLDTNLNINWVNYYPDLFEFHAYGDALLEMPSGDILLYLSEGIPISVNEPWVSGEAVLRIIKTDSLGNLIFNKILPDTFNQAVGYGDLSRMSDGHYLLSSKLVGLDYEDELLGLFRYNTLLFKIGEDGDVIWSTLVNYSKSGNLQQPTSTSLLDGGGGVMWSRDTFGAAPDIKLSFQELNIIDNGGNTIKRHAWLDLSLRYFYRIISAANGDILGVGAYLSQNDVKGKAVIFRASQTGELLWERHYSDSITRPWSPYMEMLDIFELADGRIATTGVVFDTNTVGSLNPNIGILIVDSEGCVTPGCTGVTQVITGSLEPVFKTLAFPQLLCMPNPGSNIIYIKCPDGLGSDDFSQNLIIYNMQGETISVHPWINASSLLEINVNNWDPGTYQLLLRSNNRPISSGKLVIQK